MAVAEPEPPITIEIGADLSPQLDEAAHEVPQDDANASLWQALLQQPNLPDSMLRSFVDLGLFLDELGHRAGPKWLLEELAERYRHPEAVLTITKQAYTDPIEPVERFESLLRRYAPGLPWLLESLAYWKPSSDQKRSAYLALLPPECAHLRQIGEVTVTEARAKETGDCQEIRRLFAIREPRILRALAANPATPKDLLEILSSYGGGSLARVIRSLAKANLSRRRDGQN